MENLFEIINLSEGNEIRLRLGIRVKIAGQETICPVTKIFKSPEEVSKTLEGLTNELDGLSSKTRSIFKGETEPGDQALSLEMPSEEIWKVLSEMTEENRFINLFNELNEEKRREVAEYVLSQCNVFTGRGADFSSRYNSETALLDHT